MEDIVYDLTVVGGGPVGMWAGFYGGFRGLRVLLIESTPELGGQVSFLYPDKEITDLPGIISIKGRTLVENLKIQLDKYNPTVLMGEGVIDIQENGGIYNLITNKGSYKAKFILITTGIGIFTPNKLVVPGIEKFEGNGINYFVKNKDYYRNKRVLIVGGGNSAVDWALELKDIVKSLTLIHRRDVFRALEKNVHLLLNSNVVVKLFYDLIGIDGNERLSEATIKSSQTDIIEKIELDEILIFTGYKADLTAAKKWGLEMDGSGILVDGRFQTSRKGIYAVGDIASPMASSKLNLLVIEFGQATIAVNAIKKVLEPTAPSFVHSTAAQERKSN